MDLQSILQFLQEHKEELKTNFGVEKVGVFGSVAKEQNSPQSDIDFFVVFSKKSFRNLARLYAYFENAFNTKIDIVTDHKNMRQSLRREIENSIVYG